MEAIFSHHTVILDHSSHIEDVSCTSDHIKVCFKTPEARDTVKKSWKEISSDEFNLATYHINCGHLHGESRSFFRASKPTWQDDCVTVSTTFLDEKEALHGGELSWGTYTSPHLVKRERVKGHARVSKPEQIVMDGSGGDEVVDLTKNASALHEFFGPVVQVDTDVPDSGTQGGGFMDYEGDLVKRGLFSWLVDAFEALIGVSHGHFDYIGQCMLTVICAPVNSNFDRGPDCGYQGLCLGNDPVCGNCREIIACSLRCPFRPRISCGLPLQVLYPQRVCHWDQHRSRSRQRS